MKRAIRSCVVYAMNSRRAVFMKSDYIYKLIWFRACQPRAWTMHKYTTWHPRSKVRQYPQPYLSRWEGVRCHARGTTKNMRVNSDFFNLWPHIIWSRATIYPATLEYRLCHGYIQPMHLILGLLARSLYGRWCVRMFTWAVFFQSRLSCKP